MTRDELLDLIAPFEHSNPTPQAVAEWLRDQHLLERFDEDDLTVVFREFGPGEIGWVPGIHYVPDDEFKGRWHWRKNFPAKRADGCYQVVSVEGGTVDIYLRIADVQKVLQRRREGSSMNPGTDGPPLPENAADGYAAREREG